MRLRSVLRRGGLTALAAALVVPAGITYAAPPTQPKPTSKDIRVTLITGDQIVLPGGNERTPGFRSGPGRQNVAFSSTRINGHLTIIPADVQPLIDSGRLDRRLFDVTGLVKAGYDDAHSQTIPILTTHPSAGLKTPHNLPAGITAGKVDKAAAGTFLAGLRSAKSVTGGKIWLDGKRSLTLDQSVPQIGAPTAWQAGYIGTGVTVAVLDSGIDTTHPDLAGQVVGAKNFVDSTAGDQDGHGTHVASIIAGTAAASAGRYKGVAPGARLYDGKVCTIDGCPESAILAGMQWAATEVKAKIVNLSLGGPDTPDLDPLEQAVNTLSAETGALFVVAAGNDGPGASTINSPGSADAALTVGAVDKQDGLADRSSRGPRLDGAIKPDVTAPGVDIVAARSKDAVIGEPVGDQYLRLSGTSMATPHVAGSAAILAQEHPDWQAAQLKSALMASAKPAAGQSALDQGAGRVDVARAIAQTVVPEPGSLNFGTALWPHTDDASISKDVTYRNSGTSAITLHLSSELTGPDGPAPAGALRLSTDTVTVPAGGTAIVQVVSSTNHSGPDGRYTGRVVATAPNTSVVLPLALSKEVETHTLTIRNLDLNGEPVATSDSIWAAGHPYESTVYDESGTVTLRLPKDEYTVSGAQFVDQGRRYGYYAMVKPSLQLTEDTTVVLDARTARPVSAKIPRTDAGQVMTIAKYYRTSADGRRSTQEEFGVQTPSTTLYTAGGELPAAQLATQITAFWGVPGADQLGKDTPYLYALDDLVPGGFPTGFVRTVKDRDLATVTQAFHKSGGNEFFVHNAPMRGQLGTSYPLVELTAPAVLEEHLEAGPATWFQPVWIMSFPDTIASLSIGDPLNAAKYEAGKHYSGRWNAAVSGPASASVQRQGAGLYAGFTSYSDPDGHTGYATVDTASSKLYRDGTLVASSEDYGSVVADGQPADKATYRLETSMTRTSYSPLSDRVDYTATFTSAADQELKPLWTVRYAPQVDSNNAFVWKPVTVLPVTPQGPTATVKSIKVEYSTDGGTTWRTAPLSAPENGTYKAIYTTPHSAKSVSLRTTLTDADGTTVTQTTANAYLQR
ncbi:S8 family serine peptidase [Kribbella sp. NPDC026611]|uniref:S8 family peptidase n=1 Tax=Kribbella sp. NPDC026611 TaxID=3154911 RepID=UPI0033E33444